MRILFLATGESIHAYKWIRFFAEQGHEILWISAVPLEFDPIPRVKFVLLPGRTNRRASLIRALFAVRREVGRFRPDLAHVHYLGFYGVLGLVCGVRPIVYTAWGSDVLFARNSTIKWRAVRAMLRRADLLTCDALHMVQAIKKLADKDVNVEVINFGIDTDWFSPERRADRLPNAIAQTLSEKLVLSLRSLLPVYDVESLIKASPLIVARHPAVVIAVVGDGPERSRLEALTRDLGVTENVRFLGRIENRLLGPLLARSTVYVSTSLSDAGIAASTAEAMACGTPVVVTDSGENGLWIENGVSGYIVPVRSPDRLAEQVCGLLEAPELARTLGLSGRQVIVDRNDYRNEMSKMEALYLHLAGNRSMMQSTHADALN